MKMNVKEISKIFIISLAIFIIAMSFMFVFTNTNKVFADELTDNAILNFNQQFEYIGRATVGGASFTPTSRGIHVVGNTTVNGNYYLNGANWFVPIDNSSIYYLKVVSTDSSKKVGMAFSSGYVETATGVFEKYWRPTSSYQCTGFIYLTNPGVFDTYVTMVLVNVTEMFGIGNEPETIEDIKSYLPLDYYGYTTGSPVSLSYQNGYREGIKDYSEKAFTIDVVSNDFINTAYFIDGNRTEFKKLDQYVTFNGRIALDVKYTLEANDTIILDLETLSGTEFDIEYTYNGGYYTMQHIVADNLPNTITSAGGITYKNGTITIKLPVDVNTIYFNGLSWLNVYKVEYKTFNYDTALQASFDSGYKKGLSYGNGNMFGDGFSFLSTMFHGMGEILSIEFIPNVPIWALLMIPVLIGLIGLIYKLAGK